MDQSRGDHGTCAVVRIVAEKVKGNDTGFTEINATDYDADKHELYKEPKVAKKAEAAEGSKKPEGEEVDYAAMTNADLKELLVAAKVEFAGNPNKTALVELCKEHLKK